jgi:hypothetical protein
MINELDLDHAEEVATMIQVGLFELYEREENEQK